MSPRNLLWLAMLAGCNPGGDGVGKDSGDPDTDAIDTPSDDTDTPVDDTVETVDTPDPGMTVEGPISVTTTGIVTCADPGRRGASYWDIRRAASQPLTEGLGDHSLKGGALVVADLTGDGLIDVFLPGLRESSLHVQDRAGVFADELPARFRGIDLTDTTHVSVADVDNDRDLDLYVSRWELPNLLLTNDGAGHFSDATAQYGLTTEGRRSQASSWGDMDRDGDLDLVVANYGPKPEEGTAVLGDDFEVGEPAWLFRNNGDGSFTDVSDILPPEVQRAHKFNVGWHDLDQDLHPELIFVNDFGWNRPSRIFWNTPSGLVMDDGQTGFSLPFAGMGLGAEDLNGDEIPDFVQTSWKASSLLMSSGGLWFESAQSASLLPIIDSPFDQIFGWGVEFADLDLDADFDVVMGYGWWDEYGPDRSQQDAVYIQRAPLLFEDRSRDYDMDNTEVTRGIAVADINNDGWPDVVKRFLGDRTPMFLSRCGTEAWLRFRVDGQAPNTLAIGTRIRVTAGDESWVRWVRTGGTSMYAAYDPQVLFGLGQRDRVDLVEIDTPEGLHGVLRDVDTRQGVVITLQ